MLFFLTMLMGSLITISSNSWMGMWMGLEINLLSIIPLMNSNKNILSSESSMKYFITQAMASIIFLFSVTLLHYNFSWILNLNTSLVLILNSSLLTKMGTAPFHFWFPEVMEGLNWMNCLILLTWQKIAPMILIMYNLNFSSFFFLIIIISMLISGILGLNQISIRKILTYSSINHIAWMLSSMMFLESIWFYYFLIYTLISINIILIFKVYSIFFMKQLFLKLNHNFGMKLFFILNFLSLGGLPPFIGFLPKWLTIQGLIQNNFLLLSLLMIVLTLLTLYFYMRLTFSTILLSLNELNYFFNQNQNNFWIMLSNYLSIFSLLFCTFIFNFL
uniref:NADH-ubiquinone oxidoreductase chain 2 n=1 Tax=Bolitobius castaneus TaxID=877873 RepID=A0A0S2M759_9COLE|nr:NADH deshydrogenase subunit 2 [Bolitobius castaneus]